ncbi:N-alpha-acetyltransferase 15, NatA auxiliary subunit [Apis mellifera carnica]|nr:N-alpha-acetyltransferase 15, NatA auxiliary subunit [Apis mellifera carnica]
MPDLQTAVKNLAPSELKKLRNKQRKQRRKAELERQQAAQAQEKREQHNKSRQQTDPDLEQPTLDELIPEKLERIEDPLEQAIKFLQPLQDLASNRIETHLMAFEIYIRKGRTLLMLRSIKRAHGLDSNNPDLHTCLVRFMLYINRSPLEGPVGEVVKRQTSGIYSASTATQLNAEFLKKNRNSLPHLLQGARMLYVLDPSAQTKALSLITNIDGLESVTLQNCTKVLESLCNGDFGHCDSTIADYMVKCHKYFPYATAFRPPETKVTVTIKHQEKENSIKN